MLFSTAMAARLHGRVVDAANGEPLIGANLKVPPRSDLPGRAPLRGAATNLDGYFVISGLEPGAWTVEASYQGYQPARIVFEVEEGASPLREIRLTQATLALREVVVTAERTEQELQQEQVYAGNVRLDRRQMDLAPVLIQRDLLRSLFTVPGVLPTNDFSSDLNVRGSRADENLILLDGVEVYNPNHLGGLFSSFIPSAIKHTDLLRSSWPAQYGGRLGAVLQVTSREGNREELDGEVSVGVLATSLQLSAPTWQLDKSSWLVALRRTYVDLATRAFAEDEVPYHFTDAQLRANWDLGPRDRLSVTGYWGDDVFSAASLKFVFGNRAANVNWRHVWNNKWYSRAIVAFSRFRTELDFGGKETVLQTNHINDWSTRLQLEYHHNDALTLESGLVVKTVETEFQAWVFNNHKWDISKHMAEVATYVQASWRPHPLLIVEPGLRGALFQDGRLAEEDRHRVTRLEPRLGAKALLSEHVRLKAAWGLYNQGLQQFRRDGSTFSFIWVAMDSTSRPARAEHWTAGVEVDLAQGTLLELEGYHKRLRGVAEAQSEMEDHEADDPSTNKDLFYSGRGEAFGADLSLRRAEGLWTGQAGYSLSWAVRQVDELNEGKPFYAAFDKRHNLNLLVNRAFPHEQVKGWPFRRGLRFFRYNESGVSLAWRLASGPRYTEPLSATWLGDDGLNTEESVLHTYGGYNAQELDAYSRVDLTWTFTHRRPARSFECRMGVMNLFNSPNQWGVDFDYTKNPGGPPEKTLLEGVSRLPSLELTWRF
ncbi:MAG: TonB-dependent receptor [bacterium]|nr:TonB-dependent receptor [bacterium]